MIHIVPLMLCCKDTRTGECALLLGDAVMASQVCCAGAVAGAAKVLGGLQSFKINYAEARAKENPDLRDVYSHKIKSMQDSSGDGSN